ncbi:glutamate racemase [Bacillus aquiflavi]|uniref:Glutamate racemase n=1 Tax=Bacillus aquiflavi TaxID=2672567 RepID=A0A6B3W193_9BACI|nr:glutamate racemase [Bacillus aquiflavi]MBA4537488.1 glutamate racemase [Bacillus aquiflavi]NEY81743.1 glutamate racemase [Bacillus aquiflavi]UAC47456.1 glutamate racemase [Bacillus aquiflavi]
MEQPIGIIDSGVGGLTVAKEVIRQLPYEQIFYVGDTARCPYGPRQSEEVKQFTWEMTQYLLEKNIKMLVIACNTATAVVLDEIRNQLAIPVLGVIHPGSRAAIRLTTNLNIGVIGTEGTVKSAAYTKTLKSINNRVNVESLACPKFVPLVESGEINGTIAKKIVTATLQPIKKKEIDTLILGCTHYPLLEPLIKEEMGDKVSIISSGEETAKEVYLILNEKGLLNGKRTEPAHQFFTTGSVALFARIASAWLEKTIHNVTAIKL